MGIGTATPAASAVLDIASISQGLLPLHLPITQRQATTSPAQELEVYRTDGTTRSYCYTGLA